MSPEEMRAETAKLREESKVLERRLRELHEERAERRSVPMKNADPSPPTMR